MPFSSHFISCVFLLWGNSNNFYVSKLIHQKITYLMNSHFVLMHYFSLRWLHNVSYWEYLIYMKTTYYWTTCLLFGIIMLITFVRKDVSFSIELLKANIYKTKKTEKEIKTILQYFKTKNGVPMTIFQTKPNRHLPAQS